MNANRVRSLAVACTLALASGQLAAADAELPARGPVPFDSMDSDGDGFVSQEEFTHMRTQRLQQRSEQQRMMRNMGDAPDFGDIDSDGDGRVSRQEMQEHQRSRQEIRNEHRMQRPGGGMRPGAEAGGAGMGRP
jgi:hypothetical protein